MTGMCLCILRACVSGSALSRFWLGFASRHTHTRINTHSHSHTLVRTHTSHWLQMQDFSEVERAHANYLHALMQQTFLNTATICRTISALFQWVACSSEQPLFQWVALFLKQGPLSYVCSGAADFFTAAIVQRRHHLGVDLLYWVALQCRPCCSCHVLVSYQVWIVILALTLWVARLFCQAACWK